MLATSADIAIAGGANGGGKTWGLLAEAARHLTNARFGAVVFRRVTTQIRNQGGLWDESMAMYPMLGGVPREATLEWDFPAGSRIKFAHMEHEKNRLDWDGAQIPLIEFDQLEQFLETQFWHMLSRNRSTCGIKPYVRATANPVPEDDDIGGWLNKLLAWWIDQETGYAIPERAGKIRWFLRRNDVLEWGDTRDEVLARFPDAGFDDVKSLTFIPSTLDDNAILNALDPGYRGWLLSLPLIERERRLKGNWKIRASAGLVFDRAWFGALPAAPAPSEFIAVRRYWDKAGTEGGGKYTAGVLMGKTHAGIKVILDVVRGQWSSHNREVAIKQTAEADALAYGGEVVTWIEQEPGSGGKESAENTVMNLDGHTVHLDRVTGDKLTRAGPLSAQAEAHNVKLVKAAWNEDFLKEAHRFDGKTGVMDQIDAAAGAHNKLTATDANITFGTTTGW